MNVVLFSSGPIDDELSLKLKQVTKKIQRKLVERFMCMKTNGVQIM